MTLSYVTGDVHEDQTGSLTQCQQYFDDGKVSMQQTRNRLL